MNTNLYLVNLGLFPGDMALKVVFNIFAFELKAQ